MKRNFTKFFMSLAVVAGISASASAQCDIPAPEGALYNEQFEGGANGWKSYNASYELTDGGWIWSEDGDITKGAYSPDNKMETPSVCNGAMVFDSDFYDNGGTQGAFGSGDCPAGDTPGSTCQGYLVSPSIDLSAATSEVVLEFYQAVRNFNSEYKIYISRDGGATNSDTIVVNDELPTNSNHNFGTRKSINICGLAGASDVVVTFHYDANYYYWGIDDVSFVPSPQDVDMQANDNFYAKMPHYATPSNMTTKAALMSDISNNRLNDSPESTLNVKISKANGEEIYASSLAYPSIPACVPAADIAALAENKIFADLVDMPTEVGDYNMEYVMSAPGDVDSSNDTVASNFKISEYEFRNLPTPEDFGSDFLSGVRYGSSAYFSWGGYAYFPNNDNEQSIQNVQLGIISNADTSPNAGTVTVSVYQWIDLQAAGQEGHRVCTSEEIALLGFYTYFVEPNGTNYQQISGTPTSDGTEDGDVIVPEAGAELLFIAHANPFNGELNYFGSAVDISTVPQYAYNASYFAHGEKGLKGGFTSFISTDGASDDDKDERNYFSLDQLSDGWIFDCNVTMSEITGTEDINPELESAISVYPTPANNVVNLDIALEEVSNTVSVEFLDVTGAKAASYTFNNVKKDNLSVDVTSLTAGMYIVNVRTEAGMITKRISIVH